MPKKIPIILTLLTLNLFITTLAKPSYSQYTLNLTVKTNKQNYNVGETVQITGNLTIDNYPIPDGLVALEIDHRTDALIYRTLKTGTIPMTRWKIMLTDVYIGDSSGNRLANVKRGSKYYIWIWYNNSGTETVYTVLTFTIYDSDGVPLSAATPAAPSVAPGGPYFAYSTWDVPSEAALGTATIYANAFTELPKNNGTPHYPEISSTFNIITATSSTTPYTSKTTQSTYELGTYNSTFYIPRHGARLGTHTVYVSCYYLELQATNTTTFQVKLLGDINGDGFVRIGDIVLVIGYFGTTPSSPNWNPNADVDGNGRVTISDIVLTINNFGNSGTY